MITSTTTPTMIQHNVNNDTSLLSSCPAANEDDYLPNSMSAMIQGVDSEDIEEDMKNSKNNDPTGGTTRSSLFQQLIHHLDPSTCLNPAIDHISVMTYKSCLADKREEFEWRLPTMLQEIRLGGKTRTPALQKFYRLVDREHKENRIVAISASNTDTIKVLSSCLKCSGGSINQSRTALLILNNLCIPPENKVAIMFNNNRSCNTTTSNDDGSDFAILVAALLRLIQARTPNAYLCLVTLVNLSATPDIAAKRRLFHFIPSPSSSSNMDNTNNSAMAAAATAVPALVSPSSPLETYRLKSALDEPTSCIRTIESILRETVPYRYAKGSVEQQSCRWGMNVIRNLIAGSPENGLAIAKSTILPELAVTCLMLLDHEDKSSPPGTGPTQQQQQHDFASWTRDSLPDAALMVLVHLAKDDDCLDIMRRNAYLSNQILSVCDDLMATAPGIHATRASAVKEQFLEDTMQADNNNETNRSVGYSV